MVEFDPRLALSVGGAVVVIAMAFARAEVRQRQMQKEISGKAEKDVVEVQLKAMDEKLELMLEHFSIRGQQHGD